MTSVLVTGASGQVGTALLRAHPPGVAITSLSRRRVDDPSVTRHVAIDLAKPVEELAFDGIEVAVLLASRITTSADFTEISLQLQLELRALELLERMPDLKAVVYASSCTVYGVPEAFPISEQAPARPANIYALAKVATEDMLRLAMARRSVPLAILRIAQVFGPSSPDGEIIARFSRMAAAGEAPGVTCGSSVFRDYVHEADVARSIWSAIDRRANGVFNIGGGLPTTIASLAQSSCSIAGLDQLPAITATTETFSMLLDTTRAKQHLGYAPSLTPQDEMRRRLEKQ